jgi:hypothetical protein
MLRHRACTSFQFRSSARRKTWRKCMKW